MPTTYTLQEQIVAFAQLVRIEYSLFSASGIFISGVISRDLQGMQIEYLIAFLILFLTAMASFALNDYYDLEIDTKNKRVDRPLVHNRLSKTVVLLITLISLGIVGILSFFLNDLAQLLVVSSLPVFILYNMGWKKILFLKNVIIAYAFVATILLGDLVSDPVLEPIILYFAGMGFIVGLGFEIMIDIADVAGDTANGVQTIATRFSLNTAARVSILLYIVIMILDPLPFFLEIEPLLHRDVVFLSLISFPVISYALASFSLFKDQSIERITRLKQQLFFTMQVGSLVYIIGIML
jgi:geranylgeranylglycerol-phosphate geranylgeranyltransferase